ncbi:MAG: hypothetical protein J6A28_02970 [Clostridia bacterium]|nr:hypothetical protein [Clostridia bacterium]
MFFRKELRDTDKEITRQNAKKERECEECVIDVKLEHGEQIFSQYNYENQATLDEDFSDFIWRNSKLASTSKPLTIKIHTRQELNRQRVTSAIKNHYREEYLETKNEIKKTSKFSFVALFLGLLFLGLLVVFYEFADIFILDTITEIVAWVFVWEAADNFFLKRTLLRHKALRIQRLYSAKVIIIQK